jgi:sortase A
VKRRGNRAFTAIFGLIFLLGIVGVGFAAIQIYQLRTSAGNQVLPALAPLVSLTSPQVTKAPAVRAVVYSPYPKVGDVIGTISLPSLKEKLPIIEGTDDAELKRGVGHYVRSVLPGVVDNSVLAGHRDSVFSQLGKLALGDSLVVRTAAGQFTYMVSKFRIVMADDRTVIVPTTSAVLTLSTCYPFRYIGNAPKRYIVTADLIQTELAKY